eukprot:14001252-Alexandrium_andersonii.AAC.1
MDVRSFDAFEGAHTDSTLNQSIGLDSSDSAQSWPQYSRAREHYQLLHPFFVEGGARAEQDTVQLDPFDLDE